MHCRARHVISVDRKQKTWRQSVRHRNVLAYVDRYGLLHSAYTCATFLRSAVHRLPIMYIRVFCIVRRLFNFFCFSWLGQFVLKLVFLYFSGLLWVVVNSTIPVQLTAGKDSTPTWPIVYQMCVLTVYSWTNFMLTISLAMRTKYFVNASAEFTGRKCKQFMRCPADLA